MPFFGSHAHSIKYKAVQFSPATGISSWLSNSVFATAIVGSFESVVATALGADIYLWNGRNC